MTDLVDTRKRHLGTALVLLILPACITVNVYFPAAEIDEAAEAIVDEVRGNDVADGDGGETSSPQSTDETSGVSTGKLRRGQLIAFAGASLEKKIEIDIDDPVIKRIKKSLKARFAKLRAFYEKGALGEGRDGLVHNLEDRADLSLKEKKQLAKLVTAENKDRMNLYRRIQEANEIDRSRVKDIQKIFAKRWIEKSKKDWWVQNKKEEWVRKGAESSTV